MGSSHLAEVRGRLTRAFLAPLTNFQVFVHLWLTHRGEREAVEASFR